MCKAKMKCRGHRVQILHTFSMSLRDWEVLEGRGVLGNKAETCKCALVLGFISWLFITFRASSACYAFDLCTSCFFTSVFFSFPCSCHMRTVSEWEKGDQWIRLHSGGWRGGIGGVLRSIVRWWESLRSHRQVAAGHCLVYLNWCSCHGLGMSQEKLVQM